MASLVTSFSGRILHITRDFPPRSTGGISTAVGELAKASIAAGIPCAVVSFDGWRPHGRKARATLQAPIVGQGDPALPLVDVVRVATPADEPRAADFAARFRPAILQVHHSTLWPFAAALRARLSIPALLDVHVLQAEQNRLRGIQGDTASAIAQVIALAQADRILAPCRVVADILAHDAPDALSRIHVTGRGIHDTEAARRAAARSHSDPQASATVPPSEHRSVPALTGPSRSPDGPVIYVGRFADINGTNELFRAIPEILNQSPSAYFVIAGGIPENHKSEMRWLRRWQTLAPPDVQERVRFAGWLSRADLALLYSQARVLVSPSWFETFGLVILEAMLFGLPISATRAGAVTELITHEHTGLLAEPRDTFTLVANTVRLLHDPGCARRLAAGAARSARSEHLWTRVLPRLTAVYRAVRPDLG